MTKPSVKLAILGWELPGVATPLASYVPAHYGPNGSVSRTVYTSGQLPIRDGEFVATGKVGEGPGLVDPTTAAEAARVCALNAIAAAAKVAGGVDRLKGVIKLTAFVASDPTFTGQPAVADGASEILGEIFPDGHARSAVGVAVLPKDVPVEVEVIFATH